MAAGLLIKARSSSLRKRASALRNCVCLANRASHHATFVSHSFVIEFFFLALEAHMNETSFAGH